MDQRTRERLPVLPTLAAWAEAEWAATAQRLAGRQHAQQEAERLAAQMQMRRAPATQAQPAAAPGEGTAQRAATPGGRVSSSSRSNT
jgi:hypothetical protein